jgi:hypothetical protein
VFGHPEFADGTEIATSPLWLVVRTETADLDLITALLEAD